MVLPVASLTPFHCRPVDRRAYARPPADGQFDGPLDGPLDRLHELWPQALAIFGGAWAARVAVEGSNHVDALSNVSTCEPPNGPGHQLRLNRGSTAQRIHVSDGGVCMDSDVVSGMWQYVASGVHCL